MFVGFGLHDPSGTVYGSVATSAVEKGFVEEVCVCSGLGGEEKPLVG